MTDPPPNGLNPMVELSALWLPILLSAVAVFFISFMMWMVFPHHKSDWSPLPDEDKFMTDLRAVIGDKSGQFTFPHCSSPAQMKDPEWMAKYNAGPKGFMILKPNGPESIGKSMGVSFVFNVLTAVLVAYVAGLLVAPGAERALVFRVTCTVAFLANSWALVWGGIWFGRSWSSTLKEMFDGLVYAAATGALFMFMWPGAGE